MAIVALSLLVLVAFDSIRNGRNSFAPAAGYSVLDYIIVFSVCIVAGWLIFYIPHLLVEKLLPEGKVKRALQKRYDNLN